jgi:hypothetical protein
MVIRFAWALEVTTDNLLGIQSKRKNDNKPNLKITKRMKKIEKLSDSQQKFVLKIIDSHLKALGQ